MTTDETSQAKFLFVLILFFVLVLLQFLVLLGFNPINIKMMNNKPQSRREKLKEHQECSSSSANA